MPSPGFRLLAPALAIAISCFPLAAAAAPLSPEDLSRKPDVHAAALSPDGKSIALKTTVDGHIALAVMDVDSGKIKEVTEYSDAGVASFWWVSNTRLVYSLVYLFDENVLWTGLVNDGLFTVNIDGSGYKELNPTMGKQISRYLRVRRQAWPIASFDDKPDLLLASQWSSDQTDHVPIVINMVSTSRREVPISVIGEVHHFWADHANVVRLVTTSSTDLKHEILWYRDNEATPWRKLVTLDNFHPEFTPVAFDGDNKTLFVEKNDHSDKSALYKYDFAKNAVGERFFADPDSDITGGLAFTSDTHRLLGIRYENDLPAVHWFDERRAAIQEAIDKALPEQINVINGDDHSAGLLVHSYSDRNPGIYYYYDLGTHKLKKLFAARPWIKSDDLSPQAVFHYAARDGLDIPAYLTLPKDKPVKKLPLIVLAHGGPWARDEWGFDPEVQFLASRGYAVLQPQFRSSTGFGFKLFSKGWEQWGLSMQDDITDGVQNLIKQGVVDPGRVCIMGASYGGYAAMMGVAKDPDLYRCAINLFGVTDLKLQFKLSDWTDESDEFKNYGSKVLLGDPRTDGDKYDAVSPLRQAGKIKAPVLMIYGDKDSRVPMEEGVQMRDALLAQGKIAEWVVLQGEGHGIFQDANRVRLFTTIDAFLKKYNPAD